jgi:hypothetical protein
LAGQIYFPITLVLLFALSRSLTLSIDIGSAFYKSAFTNGTSLPQVSTNSQSKRISPAFVAFRARPGFNASSSRPITEDDCEFLTSEFGDKALGISHIRPRMFGGYFSALVGLTNSALKSKSAELLVSPDPARVQLNDAAAISLSLYIDSVRHGQTVDHAAIIFPAYYTLTERLVWRQAVEQSGISNFSECTDVDAIVINYMIENPKTVQKVLFVDVGATSVKAYAVSFSANATQLSYAIDRRSGGAYLTKALSGLVRERTGVTKTTDAEDRRLFSAAEKIKLDLSESPIDSSSAIVELGGIDHTVTITRAEFDGYLDSLVDALVKVAAKASDGIDVKAIELFGGSSRFPACEAALRKFGVVSRSMDPDAAVALGGAYATQFALNRSQLPVPHLETPPSLHNITFSQPIDNWTLCVEGEKCATSINQFGFWDRFSVFYTRNELTADSACLTHTYRVARFTSGNLSLRFDPHPFRFASYDKCNDTCTPGRFIELTLPKISPDVIHLLLDPAAKSERIKKLHVELETFADRVQNEVAKNATVRFYTNHSQRLEIIRCADNEKKWVNLPATAKLTDPRNFSEHIRQLKKCVGPVYRRIDENRTFWQEAQKLYQTIIKAKRALEQWDSMELEGTRSDIIAFQRTVMKIERWFNETVIEGGQQRDFTKDGPVRPKVLVDKNFEIRHLNGKLNEKYGDPNGPKLTRGDGKTASKDDLERMKNMEIMKDFSKMYSEIDNVDTTVEDDL